MSYFVAQKPLLICCILRSCSARHLQFCQEALYRKKYTPVPQRKHGQSLSRYQTSLAHFARIFNRCVETAPTAAALADRLANIAASFTRAIFSTVQRGLFEEHKLLFAFLVAAGLQRASGELPEQEWAALVRAPTALSLEGLGPPPPQCAHFPFLA